MKEVHCLSVLERLGSRNHGRVVMGIPIVSTAVDLAPVGGNVAMILQLGDSG